MLLKIDTRRALEQINFSKRYEQISNKHLFDFEESFERYSNEEVIKIIKELGYTVSFNKKEKFLNITEEKNNITFKFNISIQYGICELIWAVFKNKSYYDGYIWGGMNAELDNSSERIREPVFRNYEDLKNILIEAFKIYEDFKAAFEEVQN